MQIDGLDVERSMTSGHSYQLPLRRNPRAGVIVEAKDANVIKQGNIQESLPATVAPNC